MKAQKIKQFISIILLHQETPAQVKRSLVIGATVVIILLFAFSVFVFTNDLQEGITLEYERLLAYANSLKSATAEPVMQAVSSGPPDRNGIIVFQGASTPAPALAYPQDVRLK